MPNWLRWIGLWACGALWMVVALRLTPAVPPPVPAVTVTAPGYVAPPLFIPGEIATIRTEFGNRLNLRAGATVSAPILAKLPDGAQVTLVGGPLLTDGFRWWQVRTADGVIGWVADFADGIGTLEGQESAERRVPCRGMSCRRVF